MTHKTEPLGHTFPVQRLHDGGYSTSTGGLTKREFFAALALSNLVGHEDFTAYDAADYAVKAADALIKALNAQ